MQVSGGAAISFVMQCLIFSHVQTRLDEPVNNSASTKVSWTSSVVKPSWHFSHLAKPIKTA